MVKKIKKKWGVGGAPDHINNFLLRYHLRPTIHYISIFIQIHATSNDFLEGWHKI